MAALSSLNAPEDLSEYTNWDAALAVIRNWSVKDKFHYKTPTSNPERKTWICRDNICQWQILARRGKDGIIRMRIACREHTCVPDGNVKRAASTQKDFLDEQVSQHIRVTKSTTPRDIQDVLSLQYGEDISYHVAFECLKRLQNDDLGEQRHSFQLLPAYRDAVLAKDPAATVHLAIHSRTGKSSLS